MATADNPEGKNKPGFFRRVFGITILTTGVLGGIILMSLWLLDVWQGDAEFSWFKFLQITFLAFFLAFVGYFILKLAARK